MVRFQKRIVANDMERPYAVCMFDSADRGGFVVATEKPGPICRFDYEGNLIERVADGPGGVMTVMKVPGRDDQLLATNEFFSPEHDADKAKIVSYTRQPNGSWEKSVLCDLPYVHRFGILVGKDGRKWLVACTIKDACRPIEHDWSMPGVVYAALLPENLEQFNRQHQLVLREVAVAQLQNHGFCVSHDRSSVLIGTAAGVFRYTPPVDEDGSWSIRCLIVQATSDMASADLDGDGQNEIITISKFHGDTLSVWHISNAPDCYRLVWTDAEKRGFLHAIWAGELGGEQCAVIGNREDGRDLMRIHYLDGRYQVDVIDHDCGPANCLVFAHDGCDHILSANRETNEVAIYDVKS